MYHIPNSCTNVLGVPEFSQILGDYQCEGTQINSSGKSSIFTWDDHKYVCHFKHPASSLPEMIVNNGFSKYHCFCCVVNKISPASAQYYHSTFGSCNQQKRPLFDIIFCPYKVGEEVLHKNVDHLEPGVIEKIEKDNEKNAPIFNIKFKDDYQVEAQMDQISTSDETDIGKIVISTKDFLDVAKHLTLEDIKSIQSLEILSPL